MGVDIIRIAAENQLSAILGLLELAGSEEKFAQIDLGFEIVGLQFGRSAEFLVGSSPNSLAQVGLRKAIMRLTEILVDLNGIEIFNARFTIFALLEILVA